jgi:hypothetical protein
MMDPDIKIRSKGIIETLRERFAELEELEATGAATADTCETLVDLQELLDRLDKKLTQQASKTSH